MTVENTDIITSDDSGTMEVDFNVTRNRRRELAAALGAYLDIKPKYLTMPTLAFQIGDYNVSQTDPDNLKIIDMLESH